MRMWIYLFSIRSIQMRTFNHMMFCVCPKYSAARIVQAKTVWPKNAIGNDCSSIWTIHISTLNSRFRSCRCRNSRAWLWKFQWYCKLFLNVKRVKFYSPQSVKKIKASPGWTTIARGLAKSLATITARNEPSNVATSMRFVPESVKKSRSWIQSIAMPPGDSRPHLITFWMPVPFM